jgi:hypothetical protein
MYHMLDNPTSKEVLALVESVFEPLDSIIELE